MDIRRHDVMYLCISRGTGPEREYMCMKRRGEEGNLFVPEGECQDEQGRQEGGKQVQLGDINEYL